jgi:hypothetical protein
VSGSVQDPGGAQIPNAVVELFVPGGQKAILTTTSGPEGLFVLTGVRPGTYDLVIQAPGFARSRVQLNVSPITETAVPPIKLSVAGVEGEVSVIAAATQVQTNNVEVMSTITSEQIDKLPLFDRSVIDLATTQPGVRNASPNTNGNDIVVNGLRSTYLNVTLDGINIQDNFLRENSGGFSPNRLRIGQVSEFTVASSNTNSTVGGGAAQYNFVSPSGTNQMHGVFLWQNRNSYLAANDWFNNQSGVPRSRLNDNIFGGSVGGPIRKDKLFYYGTYEGTRVHQQTPQTAVVLTPDARNGIYTYLNNAGNVQKVNVLNLRGASVDPFVQNNILNQLPTTINTFTVGDSSPTLSKNTGGYSRNVRDNEFQDNLGTKVDYNFSSRSSFSGAFHFVRHFTDRPSLTGETYVTAVPPAFNDDKVKLYSGTWRWTPTARLSNELRGGLNDAPGTFGVNGKPPAFYEANSSVLWTSPINEFQPQGRTPKTSTIGDTVSYILGAHSLQFGMNLQIVRLPVYDFGSTVPLYSVGMGTGQNALTTADIPGIGSTDLANANTLLAGLGGFVNSYSQVFNVASRTSGFMSGAANFQHWSYDNYAGFIHDQWKVRRNLSATLGLRYDYFTPVTEQNGLMLFPKVQGDVFATLASNASLDLVQSAYSSSKKNFAPNIGLAWDVFGNGKMSVRAGYSINYVDDNNIPTVYNSTVTNSGLSTTVSKSGLSGRLSAGLPAIPAPVFKVPINEADNYALNSANAMGLVDPNLRQPYVQQWHFSIEHEIKGSLLAARYIGNHGVDELRARDFNQVDINASGFLADFIRARNNGNLARAATGVFNPAYNANITGSQPLTVFPLLASGGLLTNGTIRTTIDQGAVGTLATTYQSNGLNGSVNFFRNPLVLGANLTGNVSNSTYNALQFEFRRRYNRGLQLQAHYTYSKVLSDSLGDQQSRFEPYLDNNNPKAERARPPFDVTHVFSANGSYDLPFGTGHRWLSSRAIGRIFGGLTISNIVTWQSGSPYSIVSARGTLNRSGTRSAQNMAGSTMTAQELNDKVVGFYMTANGPLFVNPAYINTDGRGTTQEGSAAFTNQAFYNPDPGTIGNLQRRLFNNPAVFGMDTGVQKVTKIRENQSIEIRMDVLNSLNHPSFYTGESYNAGSPSARFNINSNSFGKIGFTFFDPRLVQLGLRYRF